VAAYPGKAMFKGFVGVLDAQGRATAQLNLAAVLNPSLLGTVFHHAYLTGPGMPTFASLPIELKILP